MIAVSQPSKHLFAEVLQAFGSPAGQFLLRGLWVEIRLTITVALECLANAQPVMNVGLVFFQSVVADKGVRVHHADEPVNGYAKTAKNAEKR